MKTFKQFVNESINDKGIFKAVFVVGIPGAGKSYTVGQISGLISPKIVNTDIASEFLGKKFQKQINSGTWPEVRDSARRITASTLANYLDGALPLFVDGTSNSLSNISNRMGILKSLGYDVGLIYVRASLETAMRRAKERASKIGREVDVDFIKHVFEQSDENVDFLKSEVPFYIKIDNDTDGIDDEIITKAFKLTQSFFAGDVINPVGRRMKEEMLENGYKYISETSELSRDIIKKKVSGWYRS